MDPTDADVIAASWDDPARFGTIFDRHATTLHRYLVRRVGPDDADGLLGDVFMIAFRRRESFDVAHAEARPWLYGIATNLLAKHRQREARRLQTLIRLRSPEPIPDLADGVVDRIDGVARLAKVADAIGGLAQGERDALLLFAWEGLPYGDIAGALGLGIPVGTVRSRLNRVRNRLRELGRDFGEQEVTRLRPDPERPLEQGNPGIFKRDKEHLMSTIDTTTPPAEKWGHMPAMYPRLAYRDEAAALDFLTRVFQFVERREARMGASDEPEGMLAWLEFGDGIVMLGRATDAAREVHHLHGPEAGRASVSIQVAVHDIDAHYAHAVEHGASITMPLEDAFYGFRRYEADDLEGHHWHFHESFAAIRARGGEVASD